MNYLGGVMFLFLIFLLVVRFACDIPRKTGGKPKQNPPALVKYEKLPCYATAYYWDMYGAAA